MHTLTRHEAKAAGLKRFYTAPPCEQLHTEGRFVSNRKCVRCNLEKNYVKRKLTKRRRTDKEKLGRLRYTRRVQGLPEPTRLPPTACECCGKVTGKTLHLDHCHATGEFRGWLCGQCNPGIGLLGDDIPALRRALAYLERNDTLGDLVK